MLVGEWMGREESREGGDGEKEGKAEGNACFKPTANHRSRLNNVRALGLRFPHLEMGNL